MNDAQRVAYGAAIIVSIGIFSAAAVHAPRDRYSIIDSGTGVVFKLNRETGNVQICTYQQGCFNIASQKEPDSDGTSVHEAVANLPKNSN